MFEISFRVPLPPTELSPNFHGRWQRRHRATIQYKEVVYYELLAALKGARPKLERATIQYVFYCARDGNPGVRPLDDDNANGSMKAARDTIASILFAHGNDARFKQLETMIFRRAAQCPDGSGVVITITEIAHGR